MSRQGYCLAFQFTIDPPAGWGPAAFTWGGRLLVPPRAEPAPTRDFTDAIYLATFTAFATPVTASSDESEEVERPRSWLREGF